MVKVKALIVIVVISLVGLVGIAIAAAQPTATHIQPVTAVQPPTVAQVFNLVNAERVRHGLPVLVENAALDASAGSKCSDMTTNNYFAHNSPQGKTWESFITTSYQYAGENLARGYNTSKQTVTAWINSSEHEANIIKSNYTDTGIAVCHSTGNKNYIVQQFVGNN